MNYELECNKDLFIETRISQYSNGLSKVRELRAKLKEPKKPERHREPKKIDAQTINAMIGGLRGIQNDLIEAGKTVEVKEIYAKQSGILE